MKKYILNTFLLLSASIFLIGCPKKSEPKFKRNAIYTYDTIYEGKCKSDSGEKRGGAEVICATLDEYKSLCENIKYRASITNAVFSSIYDLPKSFIDAADFDFSTSWNQDHRYALCRMQITIMGILNGSSYSKTVEVGVDQIFVGKGGEIMAAGSTL